MNLSISPISQSLQGLVPVPADKSISHRAAILSTLADGDTRIENFLDSETTHATLDCLRQLGAAIDELSPNTLVVHGRGLHSLQEPSDILFCKGSGTTIRFLAGLCAGQNFLSILDGTPALKRRPMGRVVEPLRQMGAQILGRDNDRLPPLAIRGGNLHGIEYQMPVASAQVKSAILLASLFADSPTTVIESSESRDHTERMLSAFGGKIDRPVIASEAKQSPKTRLEIASSHTALLAMTISPVSNLQSPTSIEIPSDFSSAVFFIIAALLLPNSEICIPNVGINPTRTGLLDALARMGAQVKIENAREESGEPVGDLVIRAVSDLRSTVISGADVPRMIDEFPIFAVAATQARGQTLVRDAAELRVKESDRVATVAQELRKMGAQIDERADGFAIEGPTKLRGARVNAHHDHRLAMSLAVAALIAHGETVIEGWECVADSFPGFEETLSQVTSLKSHA